MITCPNCKKECVEVDNPFREEVRHRRGEECGWIYRKGNWMYFDGREWVNANRP